MRQVTNCRVCGSKRLEKYLDLGRLPLANGLLSSPQDECERFPLEVLLCLDCHLSQLSVVVDPKVLYSNYPYRSSVSETFRRHCYSMAEDIKREYVESKEKSGWFGYDIAQPTLIDVGANDGCLIQQFKRHGFLPIMAVEPDAETSKRIPKDAFIVNDLWSEKKLAPLQRLLNIPSANYITATNVFAHVDDLYDFLETSKMFMTMSSTLIIEVPYAYHMVINNEFDTVYHEHLSYFLVKPLDLLFKKAGMTLVDVKENSIHGGTIRLFVKMGNLPQHLSVNNLIDREGASGFYDIERYKQFAKSAEDIKKALLFQMDRLSGKPVVGFGASAKGCTLLNYCGIELKEIWDDTPTKQWKFLPGVNTPIVPIEYHRMVSAHTVIILAWNFAKEIVSKTNAAGYRGYWIKPIPQVEVL